MLKRMFILGLAIAVVSLLSTVALAATYDYNDDGDVTITLTIPKIHILDMGASTDDITWVEITAADLDNGYIVRRNATPFTVSSTDSWKVTIASSEAYFENSTQTTSFAISNLGVICVNVDTGEPENEMTISQTAGTLDETNGNTWSQFVNGTKTLDENLATGTAGSRATFMVSYKIDLNWLTAAGDAQITLDDSIETTLTFTMDSNPS